MSTMNTPEVAVQITSAATTEVQKFMTAENVAPEVGGLRVSVQPGGCSGFKYSLLIEDKPAEDDTILPQGSFNVFVDPFSMQYLNGVIIDYVTSMQGSGFTFKNPNATGGCGSPRKVSVHGSKTGVPRGARPHFPPTRTP
jgi:iron-sulfur cluster assembly protein